MKTTASLLIVGFILFSPLGLRAAPENTSPRTTVTTPATGNTNQPQEKIATQPGVSEKELLLAINAKLEQLEARLTALEVDQRTQMAGLRSGVQAAFNQVGIELGNIQQSISMLKKAAQGAAPASGDKPHAP